MEFNRDTRVEAEFAKQDRIQVDIGDWLFDAPDIEFDQFARLISQRDWSSIDGSDVELRPLTRQQGFQGNKYIIKFTSRIRGGSNRADAPLIDGKLVLHRYRAVHLGPTRYRIVSELSVNPTRALAHQPRNQSIINDVLGRSEGEAIISGMWTSRRISMGCKANSNVVRQTPGTVERPKLDWDKINYIRANFKEDHPVRGCKGMAETFGMKVNTISKVVNGDTWKPRDWTDDVEPPKTKKKIMAEWRKLMKDNQRIQARLKEVYPDREIVEDAFFNERGYETLKGLLRNK